MPAKPADILVWAPSGTRVKPVAGLETNGWTGSDKPLATNHNWMFENVYDWIAHFNDQTVDDQGAGGATPTVDFSTSSNVKITLDTTATAVDFSGWTRDGRHTLLLAQDGTGGRFPTFTGLVWGQPVMIGGHRGGRLTDAAHPTFREMNMGPLSLSLVVIDRIAGINYATIRRLGPRNEPYIVQHVSRATQDAGFDSLHAWWKHPPDNGNLIVVCAASREAVLIAPDFDDADSVALALDASNQDSNEYAAVLSIVATDAGGYEIINKEDNTFRGFVAFEVAGLTTPILSESGDATGSTNPLSTTNAGVLAGTFPQIGFATIRMDNNEDDHRYKSTLNHRYERFLHAENQVDQWASPGEGQEFGLQHYLDCYVGLFYEAVDADITHTQTDTGTRQMATAVYKST